MERAETTELGNRDLLSVLDETTDDEVSQLVSELAPRAPFIPSSEALDMLSAWETSLPCMFETTPTETISQQGGPLFGCADGPFPAAASPRDGSAYADNFLEAKTTSLGAVDDTCISSPASSSLRETEPVKTKLLPPITLSETWPVDTTAALSTLIFPAASTIHPTPAALPAVELLTLPFTAYDQAVAHEGRDTGVSCSVPDVTTTFSGAYPAPVRGYGQAVGPQVRASVIKPGDGTMRTPLSGEERELEKIATYPSKCRRMMELAETLNIPYPSLENRQTKFRTSALADPYNTADQPVNLVVSESEYQYAVDLSSSTNRHTPSAATAISPPPSGIACDRAGPSYYVVPHEWDMSSLSPYGPPVPQQLMPSFMYALSTWQFQQQYLSPVDPYSYLARPAAPVHQQLVLNSSPPPEPNQFGSSGQCLSSVHKH